MTDWRISRRSFVAGVLAALAWPRRAGGDDHRPPKKKPSRTHFYVDADGNPTPALEVALGSPYVYVSPLLADGSESTCHGEIWFAWLDGEVVSSTAVKGWKSRALRRGLDRARLWAGNYGPWKQYGGAAGTNIAYRHGVSFLAKGRTSKDPALLERILEVYEKKYPKEIGRWAGRMRRELASGERVLLRYRPIAP